MLPHDYEEDQRSLKNSIQDLRDSNSGRLLLPLRNLAKKQQLKKLCHGLPVLKLNFTSQVITLCTCTL